MASPKRSVPPTTMEIILPPPDESVQMNNDWNDQADGEASEFEESVSSLYSEESTSDGFVEEEVDEEMETNSEEELRIREGDRIEDRSPLEATCISLTTADCEAEEEEEADEEEEEAEEEAILHHYRDQDLGKGIVLKVPTGAPDIDCHVEPVCAEDRTLMLDEFSRTDNDMMVSDLYRVVGNGFPQVNNTPYKLQLPLHLPSTKLDKRDLLQFMVFKKGEAWTSDEANYEDDLACFQVEHLNHFVVYARQRGEVINITPRGYTFVSSKDQRIRVEVPDGAVDTEMTISIQIQPTSMNRLEWYRAYDPGVCEGIYALSDILSIRYAVDRAFNKPAEVELPIEDTGSDEVEVKWLNVDNGVYSVSSGDHGISNGSVRMSHGTTGTNSCQATLVRPGVSDDRLIECAMLQRNELSKCKILTFLSRAAGINCKCITIEVVESPNAGRRVRYRQKKGFHEIKQSRSPDIDVLRDERIRLSFSGNIQLVDKREMKNLTFQYTSTSEENFVDTRIKRVGFMCGVSYGIVTIKIGSDKWHEIHFYADYPLDKTLNLNKQTQSKDSDHIKEAANNYINPGNAQIPNNQVVLNARYDINYPTAQTDAAREATVCDWHLSDITTIDTTAVSTPHMSASMRGHTVGSVRKHSHSEASTKQRKISHTLSVTPSPATCIKSHGHLAKDFDSQTAFTDSTSGIFTEELTISPMSNNREDASACTPLKQKPNRNVQKRNMAGTPTLPLPNIHNPRTSVNEHHPLQPKVLSRNHTTLTKSNMPERQLHTPHLGSNVPGVAGDKMSWRILTRDETSFSINPRHAFELQCSTKNKDNCRRKTTLADTLTTPDTEHNHGIQRGHKKPTAKLPPIAVKEPRGPTKTSSFGTLGNPLLSESSLLGLSHALTTPEWQQVMVDLGMGADNITVIVERAMRENWDPRFKLLMAWYQKHSGKANLMRNMEESMRHIDRVDIAEKIRRARRDRRPFKKDNFSSH
ncbi:uncharacterized protein LOC125380059 isoform X1 [Haliotis rufescens]|uniref:uncharacterized protein LOC125380059 isoform X1 n=1 Tax=Haliotis rufescens TaxID=6454 RepID=UPI00201F4E95|nr:uncharacterized protein LOC125380059 isoform X1 [Haliotis rufescens]